MQSRSIAGPADAGDILYLAELSFAHGLQIVSCQNSMSGYLQPQFLQFATPCPGTTIY